MFFDPKFHCELSPNERLRCQKKHTHTYAGGTSLRKIVPDGLDSVNTDMIFSNMLGL